MDPFPLTTLLALRQREEEAALAEWAGALAALRAAEAGRARLGDEVEAARQRFEAARGAGEPVRPSVTDLTARQRFVARRRDEWTDAVAAERAFRTGPLLAASRAEVTARGVHADRRRGREAVDRQKEQWLAEAQRRGERQAEDARDDLTAAARHGRAREP